MKRPVLLEISGKSFWRVWVADTVAVSDPGGGVEQQSEDVMMQRKMSLFPILAVHAFSFPWSLPLLRWHYGWRCRGGKGPSWLKPVTFPIFHSPAWVNKDVLLMLPDATSTGSTPVQHSCAGSPLLTETIFPWYIFWSCTMYASFMKVWSTQTCCPRDTQSVGEDRHEADNDEMWHRWGDG